MKRKRLLNIASQTLRLKKNKILKLKPISVLLVEVLADGTVEVEVVIKATDTTTTTVPTTNQTTTVLEVIVTVVEVVVTREPVSRQNVSFVMNNTVCQNVTSG